MTLYIHELRRGRKSLLIWSGIVAFMLFIVMIMFPEMKNQMDGVNEMFTSMGDFTAAFGMDKINFGEVMGFYAIEGGNMLGIGGAFFAAMLGVGALAKEEANHTAEFLLTHPISRYRIISEKLLAVITQLMLFNAICIVVSIVSFYIIGEDIIWDKFLLFHLGQFLMHIEIACICFCLSAFLKLRGMGIGLGFAALLYFLNIIGNISEKADFVKYITPFRYAEPADIIAESTLDGTLVFLGILYSIICIGLAYWKYSRKDIAA
ncbi:ABC transporter permease subunit [Tissierella sp.]|uniref:ABC transporter permease subunit n=1 Tax=Tissierella sp. TaxID=41274 RepID=UPI0028572B6C|nr:ABC transporter permease subunit [Tissierella sp.]MDR7855752.1 ABC transporter permease subunit [Tissierella sp.]